MCANLQQYAHTVIEFFDSQDHLFAQADLRKPLAPRVRETLRKQVADSFAILTACNPDGRPASDEQNRKETERLKEELHKLGKAFLRSDGRSPDGEHRETGVAVVLGKEEARALARKYEQEAIFWFDGSGFRLVGATREFEEVPLPLAPEVSFPCA